MLEYHITGRAELLVTRRKTFAECCTARQIVAPACIWQIDGDKPEPIYKNFAWAVIPLQMSTPYATQESVTKWRESCHQLLFLTGERTSDVSNRCCFFVAQQFLLFQNYETNQSVITLHTIVSHSSPSHPPLWKWQLAALHALLQHSSIVNSPKNKG